MEGQQGCSAGKGLLPIHMGLHAPQVGGRELMLEALTSTHAVLWVYA